LVEKDFSQQPGVNYGQTFALVARVGTIRTILATKTQNMWKFYQMDVKLKFLNCILEEVYVEKTLGYMVKGHQDKVYILKKYLYGKQDPKGYYRRIDSYMINNGFNRSNNEPTLYTNINKQVQILSVCLYVDDMIFIGNLSTYKFKSAMKQEL